MGRRAAVVTAIGQALQGNSLAEKALEAAENAAFAVRAALLQANRMVTAGREREVLLGRIEAADRRLMELKALLCGAPGCGGPSIQLKPA